MARNLFFTQIFLVLTVLFSLLTGTPALAQSAAVVRVDPATLPAKANDSVNVTVKIDNIANLTAFELHLSFNPSVLEVTQVTNGGFVVADFTAQNIFDNAAGTLDYAVAQMNRPAVQGSGTLLKITFRAKANGSSSLALRVTQAAPTGLLLADSNGMALQASWVNGTINVGNVGVTPATPLPAITSTPGKTNTPGVAPTTTNTPGVIPTTTNIPKVTPTATSVPGGILGTHSVRFGEYIFCIGRAYGVSPWAIAQENGIQWPYLIFPGQALRIPNVIWTPIPSGLVCQRQFTAPASTSAPVVATALAASATPVVAPTATPSISASATPVPASTCRAYHLVLPGDTLYRIAVQYGTSYAEIARVNQITNATLIYAGQQLCIP